MPSSIAPSDSLEIHLTANPLPDWLPHHPPSTPPSNLTAMAWESRGANLSGRVQESSNGQSRSPPAVTYHRGHLWCIWSDLSGQLWYAKGNNDVFEPRQQFPGQGNPSLESLNGVLHLIVVEPECNIVHWMYDDEEEKWEVVSTLEREEGAWTEGSAALCPFHNTLYLVFLRQGILLNTHFDLDEQTWTPPTAISERRFLGIPALFVLENTLHVLCGAAEENREIVNYAYSPTEETWTEVDDISEGKAAFGVSAESFGNSAYLAFQEKGPDDDSHSVYVSEYVDGHWLPQEPVCSQASADPPQLAVLNGRINCIFNANTPERDLLWFSRSLLTFDPRCWMSKVDDERLVSDMTIPGTHDTCARSNIPFVRTQYLSVTQQLEAGLRFVDLRVRVHGDGGLYMYHGGIPIAWPKGLSFASIMDEIFAFLDTSNPSGVPSETVVVSINNDDAKAEDHATFYNAMQDFIDKTPRLADGSERWIYGQHTPTLGEARGKVVLLRRFQHDPVTTETERIGIDVSAWQNNNPDFTITTTSGLRITIQDHWCYYDPIPLSDLIDSKFSYVEHLLEKCKNDDEGRGRGDWYVNFCSAVGDPAKKGEVAESKWIAVGHTKGLWRGEFVQGMNVRGRGWGWGKGRYGVVLLDYPELPKESDLVARLVETNF